MKPYVVAIIVMLLSMLFLLPAAAESNIAALVEEQFTSAQEELGIDEIITDQKFDPHNQKK